MSELDDVTNSLGLRVYRNANIAIIIMIYNYIIEILNKRNYCMSNYPDLRLRTLCTMCAFDCRS